MVATGQWVMVVTNLVHSPVHGPNPNPYPLLDPHNFVHKETR